MPAARVVHVEARERWSPILQHAHQSALRDRLGDLFFVRQRDADIGERGPDRQMGVVDDERTVHADRDRLASLLELPAVGAARKTQADASMVVQILGCAGNASRREIARRTDHRQPQFARDADRDHILLDEFAELDAGIELAGDEIHRAGDGNDIQNDVGVSLGEGRDARQQHHRRGRSGHRDSQAPGRPAAKAAGVVQGVSDLIQRRGESLQKGRARGRRRDALGRAGEKLQPEPPLELADRVADRGLGDAQLRCGAREAALAGDRRESGEFVEFVLHGL